MSEQRPNVREAGTPPSSEGAIKASDPILLEVMKGEFLTIVEEMCAVIGRTARSFGARDGGDYSGVVIHPNGQVVARAGVSTWYVGNSLPFILEKYTDTLRPGDIVVHNDPYSGGTHLPDIILVMPVFQDDGLIAYVGNSIHHTDVGGFAPGGMSPKPTELFQEGLLLPRVLLYERGKPVKSVFEIIAANTRAPDDVMGDLDSQIAGCLAAARDVQRLAAKYSADMMLEYGLHLISYSERAIRDAIASIPDGTYRVEDEIHGSDDVPPIRIVLSLEVDGDSMTVDFTGTDPQSPSALNVPPSTVAANLLSDFPRVFEIDVPANSGLLTPISIVTPEGTALNPRRPAAVGARSAICNRLSGLLLRALAQAVPERVRAENPGPQMLVYTPDSDHGASDGMVFDLWIGGGGARPSLDGLDGPVGFRRIPGEMLERDASVALEGYGMVPDTGGPGRFRGGLSIFRRLRFLAPGRLWLRNLYAGRGTTGLLGGGSGSSSVLLVTRAGDVVDYSSQHDVQIRVEPGDEVYQTSVGGGGHGDPMARDIERVVADVIEEKVTVREATDAYGVVLDTAITLDVDATEARRRAASREP